MRYIMIGSAVGFSMTVIYDMVKNLYEVLNFSPVLANFNLLGAFSASMLVMLFCFWLLMRKG